MHLDRCELNNIYLESQNFIMLDAENSFQN